MLDRRDADGSASEDACAEDGAYRKEHSLSLRNETLYATERSVGIRTKRLKCILVQEADGRKSQMSTRYSGFLRPGCVLRHSRRVIMCGVRRAIRPRNLLSGTAVPSSRFCSLLSVQEGADGGHRRDGLFLHEPVARLGDDDLGHIGGGMAHDDRLGAAERLSLPIASTGIFNRVTMMPG